MVVYIYIYWTSTWKKVCINVYCSWNKIISDVHSCLFFVLVSRYEKMIGSRVAWTDALHQSVTTHYKATKRYFLFLKKMTKFESWDLVLYQK